ncbi:transposase [Aggregatibacter sp. 2125159857]|uniref:transposase n=1 Tax=Aggregatibacter sp. 2125159857 TaxID=2820817 RepID=UPI001AE0CFB5|nr:transposase [Aggregatibacter sp. 2125159857]QTO00956.1 transposase [Aggregatibacter sp. 2125159857]
MSYSYQFRLEIIKLVTEQDYGIREVAKLHKISHALVIYWLKAFRERGLDGVKSPYTNLQTPKIVKPKMKMKKKDIEIPETTDFSPKAFKKLQRELALARAEIAYLKELEALDRQKQRQKKENSLND